MAPLGETGTSRLRAALHYSRHRTTRTLPPPLSTYQHMTHCGRTRPHSQRVRGRALDQRQRIVVGIDGGARCGLARLRLVQWFNFVVRLRLV